MFGDRKTEMVAPEKALPGRETPIQVAPRHTVLGGPLAPPYPDGAEVADFAMGCFWGAERIFWRQPGVLSTAVGYQGGYTPNPTYEEVCSGRTGHTEVVRVVFDPAVTSYEQLLKVFWENHDPTQGFRQGNDVGTQYRSAVYTHGEAQAKSAAASRDSFAPIVHAAAGRDITTEIAPAPDFFFAEDYHQQYLSDAKNPNGYCNIGPNGLTCPIGLATTD
ncbi:peptide-methionine (S)-S-oxide reductase MsrA [Actinocorallia lasiicapitis]